MTKRNRSVLLSVLVLVLCLALIAGGSYALFTDEITLEQHLQAGTLKATLVRTELVTKELDGNGFLVSNEDDPDKRRINFTEATTENAFGIDSTDKIVPGSKYKATFELSNSGDTAFGYWIEIGCTDKKDGENLAKQVKITVNDDKNSAFVGDGLIVKAQNSNFISVLSKGGVTTFTVTVEFLDSHVTENLENNNLAKGQSLYFDLVVKAIQVTEAP